MVNVGMWVCFYKKNLASFYSNSNFWYKDKNAYN